MPNLGPADVFKDSLQLYIDEYQCLAAETHNPLDKQDIHEALTCAEWSDEGATALIELAHNYGAWFLLHAAALAKALDIEDGDLNF